MRPSASGRHFELRAMKRSPTDAGAGGGRHSSERTSKNEFLANSRRVISSRVGALFTSKGIGFRRLAESHATSVAGDTLIAIALAGTLFFSVPSAQARSNMLLYLLVTLAPFTVLGPLLGRLFDRFPGAYRLGLAVSSFGRAMVTAAMIGVIDSLLLYPLAFALLLLSRVHGISRASLLPVVLPGPHELVTSNAQLARIGVLVGLAAAAVGALAAHFVGTWLVLVIATAVLTWSGWSAMGLPSVEMPRWVPGRGSVPARRTNRPLRLAGFATAGVRSLNGFLLLLVAFAYRDIDAGIFDFGAILVAAGVGFFAAAVVTPIIEKYVPEEPMMVAALAVEAAFAFLAGVAFGLPTAAALAAAAGFAWGTAKFGFDGLLQATVPAAHRGRAFTYSETLFQIAWVIGAALPVAIPFPSEIGLVLAGFVALFVQLMYVSALLIPVAKQRRERYTSTEPAKPRQDVTDLF